MATKKHNILFIPLMVILSLNLSCVKKIGSDTTAFTDYRDKDWNLLIEALDEIKVKNYEYGRLLLNKISNKKLLPIAKLIIADSYYRESDLRGAAGEYNAWLSSYPNHKNAPLVMLKLAETHMRKLYFRSDGGEYQAQEILLELQKFPQFKDDERVSAYSIVVQELMAQHYLGVAKFYFERRDAWKASESRCLDIVNKFPNFSKMDIALWYLARSEEEEENIDDAIKHYQQIAREYPNSPYRNMAIEKLNYFNRELPMIDPDAEARLLERSAKMSQAFDTFDQGKGISRGGVLINEMDQVNSALIADFYTKR